MKVFEDFFPHGGGKVEKWKGGKLEQRLIPESGWNDDVKRRNLA